MMDIIFDYGDMFQNGMIKNANMDVLRKTAYDKYAVILQFEGAQQGKFPISDKEEVNESIFAIQHNPKIPSNVVKTAKYFVKQAAANFGIEVPWKDVEKQPHVISYDSFKKEAQSHQFILKIAGSTFDLNMGQNELEDAQTCFLTREQNLSGANTINISRLLVKKAAQSNFVPDNDVKAFALSKYGSRAKNEFDFRINLSRDSRYKESMEKISTVYRDIKPEQFLDLIKRADESISLRPSKYGRSYANFFKDKQESRTIDMEQFKKIAMANGDKDIASII